MMPRLFQLLGALALLLAAAPARTEGKGDPELPRTQHRGQTKAQGVAQGASAPRDLPRALRLDYTLGPGTTRCPTSKTMADAVLAKMSFDPFVKDAPARIVVTIRRQGILHKGHAEIVDAEGKVRWSSDIADEFCFLVTDALALSIGIQFASLPPPTPPLPPPSSPPAPAPAPRTPPAPLTPAISPRPQGLRFGLGLSGALAVRTAAPTFAFDLRGDAGLRWRALSIDGELRFAPPAGVDASGGTQAAVSQISGGIVPCGHFQAFFLCGVAQVTAVMVTGIHDPGDSATVFTGATGPRVGKDVPLWGRFALRVSADLLATLHPVVIPDGPWRQALIDFERRALQAFGREETGRLFAQLGPSDP
jgi:hypothetical protein